MPPLWPRVQLGDVSENTLKTLTDSNIGKAKGLGGGLLEGRGSSKIYGSQKTGDGNRIYDAILFNEENVISIEL